jgi:hypothetical protein
MVQLCLISLIGGLLILCKKIESLFLVGGFNPSEKYESQLG